MAKVRKSEVSAKKAGRPRNRWKIRVVRIDAKKYPRFAEDSANRFASMAAEARIEEIDAFLARLRMRAKKTGRHRSAAA